MTPALCPPAVVNPATAPGASTGDGTDDAATAPDPTAGSFAAIADAMLASAPDGTAPPAVTPDGGGGHADGGSQSDTPDASADGSAAAVLVAAGLARASALGTLGVPLDGTAASAVATVTGVAAGGPTDPSTATGPTVDVRTGVRSAEQDAGVVPVPEASGPPGTSATVSVPATATGSVPDVTSDGRPDGSTPDGHNGAPPSPRPIPPAVGEQPTATASPSDPTLTPSAPAAPPRRAAPTADADPAPLAPHAGTSPVAVAAPSRPQGQAPVATADAVTPTPVRAPVDDDPNVARLTGVARSLIRTGGGHAVSVTLTPVELGRVRVEISAGADGRVAVHLSAEHAIGADALRAGTAALRSSLESEGLQLDQVSVALGDAGQERNGSGANPTRDDVPAPRRGLRLAGPVGSPSPVRTTDTSHRPHSGLDLDL